MPGWVLIVLVVLCAASIVAALVYLALSAWHLAKAGMSLGSHVAAAVQELTPQSDAVAAQMALLSQNQEQLSRASRRSSTALARLSVLLRLYEDARAPLRWLRRS